MKGLTHEIWLSSPSFENTVQFSKIGTVNLVLKNPRQENARIVEVGFAGKTRNLECSRSICDLDTPTFHAEVDVLELEESKVVFLIGVYQILALDAIGNIRDILKLFRSENDDPGFYTEMCIIKFEDFFILRYESGIARISYDGEVAWHTKLFWDDIYLSVDDEALVFSNEHELGGGEWRVNLCDGILPAELDR